MLNSFCARMFLSGPLQMMVLIMTTVAVIPDSEDAVKIKRANTQSWRSGPETHAGSVRLELSHIQANAGGWRLVLARPLPMRAARTGLLTLAAVTLLSVSIVIIRF